MGIESKRNWFEWTDTSWWQKMMKNRLYSRLTVENRLCSKEMPKKHFSLLSFVPIVYFDHDFSRSLSSNWQNGIQLFIFVSYLCDFPSHQKLKHIKLILFSSFYRNWIVLPIKCVCRLVPRVECHSSHRWQFSLSHSTAEIGIVRDSFVFHPNASFDHRPLEFFFYSMSACMHWILAVIKNVVFQN